MELEPIPHFKMTDYVRVPVRKNNGKITVHLSKSHKKFYTINDAPDFVISKIVIADALAKEVWDEFDSANPYLKSAILVCPEDGGDPDNAWKVTESLYIIVIHVNDFYYMQGEFIGNPRKESQRQSKKDIR
jgi:hypothetical protein